MPVFCVTHFLICSAIPKKQLSCHFCQFTGFGAIAKVVPDPTNMRWSMSYWRACERIVLGAILALSFSTILRAQEQQQPVENAQLQTPANNAVASNSTTSASPTDDKWHFVSLSYLWFPGVSGTVGG